MVLRPCQESVALAGSCLSMIRDLATTIWYAFLIVLGLWTAGALAGVVALGFRMVVGY